MKYERTAVSQATIKYVASQFQILGDFIGGEPYGSGHINDTFSVSFCQGGALVRYIFQRINHGIFQDPEGLMDNIQRVTAQSAQVMKGSGEGQISRKTLTVISSRDGKPYVVDPTGYYWRSYIFIEKAKTYDRIENEKQAYEAAKAFGQFQGMVADMKGERLNETIPDFHNTKKRYQALMRAIEKDACNRAAGVKAEIEFFTEREADTRRLIELLENGLLPERVAHNDCKLNNVMIDDETGEGVCVIDLDTVMPGLSLYDFGDMVRTATSPALEDEPDVSLVTMQMPMFEALVKGFIRGAGEALCAEELAQMPFSGKLITMETGIRFLTDYLEGDQYFKTHREGHNLDRCRTQIALVRSIEAQLEAMDAVVEHCAKEVELSCVS